MEVARAAGEGEGRGGCVPPPFARLSKGRRREANSAAGLIVQRGCIFVSPLLVAIARTPNQTEDRARIVRPAQLSRAPARGRPLLPPQVK